MCDDHGDVSRKAPAEAYLREHGKESLFAPDRDSSSGNNGNFLWPVDLLVEELSIRPCTSEKEDTNTASPKYKKVF